MTAGKGSSWERTIMTERSYRLLVLAVAILGAGCSGSPTGIDDLDLGEFDALPAFESLDYERVTPADDYDYWELRQAIEGISGQAIAVVGSRESLPPEVQDELEAIALETGFGPDCLPGGCHEYIVSVSGTSVETWATIPRLREFLGAVDTREDAALLVHAHGYYWSGEKRGGAIRGTGDGYDVIALRLVQYCAPVQVDRYLLRVSGSGELAIRAREVWSRSNACI